MANIQLRRELTAEEKLLLMREDARYDVADARDTDIVALPAYNDILSIKAPPPPPKVGKLFVSGTCMFNCAYCGCRASNTKWKYCVMPHEMAKLAVADAKKSGTNGTFISSAIYKNADYTQELIAETARIMREELYFTGYLHAKVMPGADPLLIEKTGLHADRLSVNIEVAHSTGYGMIAHQKNKKNILGPMGDISGLIKEHREGRAGRRFALSQTTQLMAGSTNEDDRAIMTLSRALYDKYALKRVYYTPFTLRAPVAGYDAEPVKTPHWRMARLYQADRLMQVYGFAPDEVTPESDPFLKETIDPKAAFALRNLHMFPVEVNTADYEQLLRVPGIGVTFARRIVEARRHRAVTHDTLKKIGVSLKKCRDFITCGGKMERTFAFDNGEALEKLLSTDAGRLFGQESLFTMGYIG